MSDSSKDVDFKALAVDRADDETTWQHAQRLLKERDEARAVMLKVGLHIRQHLRNNASGWTSGELGEALALLDAQLWREETP